MSALEPILESIASGEAKPVYVLLGQEFLVRQAAEALVGALVPKASASLNVSIMDAPSAAEVVRDLSTVGMFGGAKVVWAREPEFLLPKKGRTDALGRCREAWAAGRRKDAARRVLGLAARAGWTVDGIDPSSPQSVGADAWKEELDVDLTEADRTFLIEVAKFCREEKLAAPESDGQALEELFKKGLPRGHHLVIEASAAETRGGLYKKLVAAGTLIERKVEKELRKLDIHDQVLETLKPYKKRISRDAEEALKGLCGNDMRLVQSELEKLALYIGPAASIETEDVRLLVARAREGDFFELGNALQTRNVHAATAYVRESLEQGTAALPILFSIATAMRRLLEDRERYSRMKVAPRLNFREFQEVVFPAVAGEAKAAGKKAPHPFVAFLSWQAQTRYTRGELVSALLAIGECDLELKSSADDQLALERLLFKICQRPA